MNKINLGKRTLLVAAGQSVAKSVQIIFALILVRLLSESDWAAMAMLLTIYYAAVNIGSLNLHMGLIYFYGRLDAADRKKLVHQTIGLLSLTGLVCVVIILSLRSVFTVNFSSITGLLPWIALAVFLELPTLLAPQLLLAMEQPGKSSAYNGAMALIQFVAILSPILMGHGLKGAAIGLVFYAVIRFVAFIIILCKSLPPGKVVYDWKFIKEQLIYTAPLSLSMANSILNRNIDKWFVALFDVRNFGAYALAAHEVPFISLFPHAMGAVLSTRMVHAFKQKNISLARKFWLASTSKMILFVVPATIVLVLCAPEIVNLFFTKTYMAALVPFQIYLVILLHRIAEYGSVLRAAGDTKSIWWSSFVILGANVVFSLPLTMAFGMIGAASGTLIANIAAWIFVLTRIARLFHAPFREVLPWRLYILTLLTALISAASTLLVLGRLGLSALWNLPVKGFLFYAVFISLQKIIKLKRMAAEVPADNPEFLKDINL